MQALVTGGAGFIGSHLVRRLVAAGHRIVVLDDLSTGHARNLAGVPHRFVAGDVADAEVVNAAVAGCQTVFHLGAVVSVQQTIGDPTGCMRVNALGTQVVLEAARQAGATRFVLASTAAAYGDAPTLPCDETAVPAPMSPYGASKVAGEHLCRVYSHLYGMRATPLRFFNVYGERQDPTGPYAGVISKFVERLQAGQPVTIFGDGGQTRDFVYVGDVVGALMAAAERSDYPVGLPINIGGGASVDLLDLYRVLASFAGTDAPPLHAAARDGDIRHSVARVSRAKDWLNWEASTGLEAGLAALWRSVD